MGVRRTTIAGALVLALISVIQLSALVRYADDERELRGMLDRAASTALPPSEQAKRIVEMLKNQPDDENQAYCLLPVFSFLRATAREVAEGGGDCADRSRLLVVMLNLRGISASKWALYSTAGHPRHSVVESQVESGPMVLDPLFGMWFPKPGGGYYGIRELQANPDILRERVAELRTLHEQHGSDSAQEYPLEDYTYDAPRTINWSKSAIMRMAYPTLKRVVGNRIDTLPRPLIFDQPALMILVGMSVFETGFVGVWLVWTVASRRRSDSRNRPARQPEMPMGSLQ